MKNKDMDKVSNIIKKLKIKPLKVLLEENKECYAVYLNTGPGKISLEKVIMIISGDDIRESEGGHEQPVYFIIGECNELVKKTLKNKVMFDKKTDRDMLFSEVSEVLNASAEFERHSLELAQLLLKNNSLENLCKKASEILQNPLFMVDSSAKAIIKSGIAGIDANADEGLSNSLNRGYVSYDFIKKSELPQFLEGVASSAEPVIMEKGYGLKYRRMMMRIKGTNHQYNNFLTLVEINHKFNLYDCELLKLLAKLINMNSKKERNYFQNNMKENFLLGVIKGEFDSREESNERLRSIGWEMKKCKKILYICSKEEIQKQKTDGEIGYYLSSLQYNISIRCPWTTSMVYQNGVMVFLEADRKYEIGQKEEELFLYLKENKLIAGASSDFEDFQQFRLMCLEAVQSAQTGYLLKMEGLVFNFSDNYFYNLLGSLEQPEYIERFCISGLKELKEADRENGTAFYITLHNYLLNGLNMREVARKMEIHRNTIAYRIAHACEVLNVNLNEGTDVYKLFISYKIIEMKEMSF